MLRDLGCGVGGVVDEAGAPDKEAVISSLEPGEAAVRRFRFDGGGVALRGERIRIGLIERDGTGRINTAIEVR